MTTQYEKVGTSTLKITTILTQERAMDITELLANKAAHEALLARFDAQALINATMQTEQRLDIVAKIDQSTALIAEAVGVGIDLPV